MSSVSRNEVHEETPLVDVMSSSEGCRQKEVIKRVDLSTFDGSVFQHHENIEVVVRLKPIPETQQGSCYCKVDDETLRFRKVMVGERRDTCYKFNHVFEPEVNQTSLYNKIIEPKVKRFLRGGDVLIFSYGTASSGKTHTIQGNAGDPGIIPRSLLQIFKSLHENIDESLLLCPNKSNNLTVLSEEELSSMISGKERMMEAFYDLTLPGSQKTTDSGDSRNSLSSASMREFFLSLNEDTKTVSMESKDTRYSLWVSFVEVYNESIFDLLDYSTDCNRKPLKLACDTDKMNYVKDLNYYSVSSWSEAWKLFMCGRNKLHMTATKVNQSSSRSHSIFTLKLVKKSSHGTHCSSFSVCDLAGAERQKKVQNEGFRLRETLNINTSLLVLNRCLSIMRENQFKKVKIMVPYRDSKLTQLFKNALLSNDKILMIINISQCNDLIEETQQVLKMSAVARDITVLKPKKVYRNPKTRFSIFCSASPSVSPAAAILVNDDSKEDECQQDPEALKNIISNLEQQLKDINIVHEGKVDALEGKIDALENEVKRLTELLKFNVPDSMVDESEYYSFLEMKKRKIIDDGNANFYAFENKKEHLDLLQALNEAKEQIACKTEECYSLRTQINSLEYKLSMQNSNKHIQELIQNLVDQDVKSALQNLIKEKTKSDNNSKVLESVIEEAKTELLSLEKKLNDNDFELNLKTIEVEELKSELEEKNQLLTMNSEKVANLEQQLKLLKNVGRPKVSIETNLTKTETASDDLEEALPRAATTSKKSTRRKKEVPEYLKNSSVKSSSKLLHSNWTPSAQTSSRRLFCQDVDQITDDLCDIKIISPEISPAKELRRHKK